MYQHLCELHLHENIRGTNSHARGGIIEDAGLTSGDYGGAGLAASTNPQGAADPSVEPDASHVVVVVTVMVIDLASARLRKALV